MDTGTALTILGVFATVLFGVIGILYTYFVMKRRYQGKIDFVVEDCLGLFESIVKHFPELSVLYEGKPVGEGIVLLKGALLNTGSKDITKEMVEDKLRLQLPENFKWLQAQVVSSSPSVRASIKHVLKKLEFDIGLFRCHEFVRFECLAEVPIPEDSKSSIESSLLNEMKVSHRIADTQKVLPANLPPLEYQSRRRKRRLAFSVGVLVVGVVFTAIFLIKGIPAKVHYHFASDDGSRIEVKIEPQDNGTILVRSVQDTDFKKQIPAADFFSTPTLEPMTVPNRFAKILFVATAIAYAVGPMTLIIFMVLGQRKRRKIRRLLGLPDKNESPKTACSTTK